MKIILYLLGKKGYIVLKKLIERFGRDIFEYIVVAKDINIINDYFGEIQSLLEDNNIIYYSRNKEPLESKLYKFAIGWRWILKDTYNLIIFHDSLLPYYRGFSPVVNALINGERKIGVTALFAKDEVDTGDIIFQKSFEINYPVKVADVIEKTSEIYSQIAVEIVNNLINKKSLIFKPQNNQIATYSMWRDEKDYQIDWFLKAEEIKRFIDAVGYPYKGALSHIENIPIRIEDASIVKDRLIENRKVHVGKVTSIKAQKPIVVCGQGLLQIDKMFNENGENLLPLKTFRTRFH